MFLSTNAKFEPGSVKRYFCRSIWTVCTTCTISLLPGNMKVNKSPKGHWSLTWVQWAILLKVRFLSKSESTTAIFVKSVRTATIAIFQFRIRGCIRFVAVAFQSEEEVLWRRNPSLTYFWQIAPPPPGSAPGWSLPKSLWTGVWLWVLHLYQVS